MVGAKEYVVAFGMNINTRALNSKQLPAGGVLSVVNLSRCQCSPDIGGCVFHFSLSLVICRICIMLLYSDHTVCIRFRFSARASEGMPTYK
jgi:hypothetical protein